MSFRYLLAGGCLLLCPPSLSAAIFCATNGSELAGAMAAAQINGQADQIRLAVGTYVYPGSSGGTFGYFPTIAENYNIEISGGWSDFFGNPCGQQIPPSGAINTLITTGGVRRLMLIQPPAGSNFKITIRLITFLGGDTSGVSVGDEGGGLMIGGPNNGHSGTVLIDQCAFFGNYALEGAALSVRNEGTIRLSNSVFVDNEAGYYYAVKLFTDSGAGIYATNNTVYNNMVVGTSNVFGGLYTRANDGSSSFVANNILWGNEGLDLVMKGSGAKFIRNNDTESLSTDPPRDLSNNLSVAPVFSPVSLDYTLAAGSPLLDAGTKPPELNPIPVPFQNAWSLGTGDVFDRQRVQGTRVDIGAYEARPTNIFKNGFE